MSAQPITEQETALRDFSLSLPMALLQAREATMRLFRPMLSEYDLTEQQWRVLRALSASPHSLEVAAVVDATFLLAPSLSRIFKDLEARNLINRSVLPSDQRRAQIELSDDGHALVAAVAPRSEAIYQAIETAYGASQLGEMIAQLDGLRDTTNAIGASE